MCKLLNGPENPKTNYSGCKCVPSAWNRENPGKKIAIYI